MDVEMQLSMAGIHPDFAQEKKPSHKAVGVSRKDTIIIAMLVNIALLAVLFATASRQPSSVIVTRIEPQVATLETMSQVAQVAKVAVQTKEPVDEIDEILKSYALKTQTAHTTEAKPAPEVRKVAPPEVVKAAAAPTNCLTVTVKKGDVLSRIAKQHGVKVEDLIVLNGLESAKLRIGQQLKVPRVLAPKAESTSSSVLVPEFYVVKSGDSPWKIAKKCRIDVDDLLRLNNLDEEKAKNLKIGQKLRTR